MIPSEPFIRRPVATTLLTLAVFLAGVLAYKLLPVSPLPQVDFPTISVQARMAGASPETMAATVATPLERALGRIAGVNEITSSSSLGSTRVTLQFDLNRNIDGAARDVQAGINAARVMLPTGLSGNPTYRKMNPADAPIMIIGLTSDSLTRGQMYDAADSILAQKILQIKGVGDVNVGGGAQPAVRVDINPLQINNYGITLENIRSVITSTNANRPKGFVENSEYRWQIAANDQVQSAKDYAALIVAYKNGAAIRLSDVATVSDSVINTRNAGYVGKQASVMLIVTRQPGANIIDTVERIRAALPALKASISPAINVQVVLDRTGTIRASLEAVNTALLTSLVLVIMVVFIFLRNGRATMVPAITVPVSLVGTFAVMYLAGFSLNNLSLMALTIATGFVVDDTIVVLENITRHIEKGLSPLQASLIGAKEVGFTVLSMSISLIAVFIPILMMGGIVGRLFREFAVTLAVAIFISMLVSLTTAPMLCARWLKPHQESKNFFHRFTEKFLNGMQNAYRRSLTWVLKHSFIVALVLIATIALNIYLYTIVPKGFFPQQDTGTLIGNVRADQNISFKAMQSKLETMIAIVMKDKAVASVTGFTGGGQTNSANIFVGLKPLKERGESADAVVARLRRPLSNVPGAQLFLQSVQDIRMGGRPSNAQYQYTLQGDDLAELRAWTPRVQQALSKLPELNDVNSDQESKGLQTYIDFDRDTMTRYGITQAQVDAALNDAFGQRQVSTIYNALNQYKVVMEVDPAFATNAESLNNIYLQSATGGAVALSSIAKWRPTNTSLSVNHQSQFAAATISFNLPAGVSLSDATVAIKNAMGQIGVPEGIYGSFQGTAKTFQSSLDSQPMLILMAILAVYIVLGMLYESLVHPVTIISTLPSAGVGALLALLLTGGEFNVIALIGVLLLVGIVKKNAIMMVDFALAAEREQHLSSHDAILQACLLRFRPIMMTTLAALFGALPLALGHGDGSEMRVPLGVAVVGGLILSQILTLYTTPVVYLYFDRFRIWAGKKREARKARKAQKALASGQGAAAV